MFNAGDGTAGRELWLTDGTQAGTARLRDILEGPADGYPSRFATVLLNTTPTLVTPLPVASLPRNTTLSLDFKSNFADADVAQGFGSLTFSAILSSGDPLPSWLSFDAMTGKFSGTPPILTGRVDLRVTATDIFGASISDNFQLDAPATAPNLVAPLSASTRRRRFCRATRRRTRRPACRCG